MTIVIPKPLSRGFHLLAISLLIMDRSADINAKGEQLQMLTTHGLTQIFTETLVGLLHL